MSFIPAKCFYIIENNSYSTIVILNIIRITQSKFASIDFVEKPFYCSHSIKNQLSEGKLSFG